MAIAVVARLFIGVAQHFVDLGDFLELFFSSLVARVFVRVKLDRFFAIRLLYVVGAGVFGNTQHFVIISF